MWKELIKKAAAAVAANAAVAAVDQTVREYVTSKLKPRFNKDEKDKGAQNPAPHSHIEEC